jgi:hypothetical protein
VEALSGDAEVSLEATGNRLVSVSDEPAAFLVLTLTHKPADTPAQAVGQCVRVRYRTTSGLDLYLPRYKSAGARLGPGPACVRQALRR